MKILIIGTARSGTTTLTNAIAHALNLKEIIEPFNPNVSYVYNPIQKNIVLKTLISQHNTLEELVDLSNSFDKTILISRRDRVASWESECNGRYKRKQILERNGYYDGFNVWHESYIHNPDVMDIDYMETVNKYIDLIVKFQQKTNLPMIWYEDLYSTDFELAKTTFESIGCGLKYEEAFTYLNPTKKYRKDNNVLL
jgi:hypothetical protein